MDQEKRVQHGNQGKLISHCHIGTTQQKNYVPFFTVGIINTRPGKESCAPSLTSQNFVFCFPFIAKLYPPV